jgi:hypothetical protein
VTGPPLGGLSDQDRANADKRRQISSLVTSALATLKAHPAIRSLTSRKNAASPSSADEEDFFAIRPGQ